MSNTKRVSRGKWIRKVLACQDCPSTLTVLSKDYVDVRHEPTCPYARRLAVTADVPIRYKGAWV